MDNSEQPYRVGDFVKVSQKITEGKKQRVVFFKGQIIRMKGKAENKTITVRQNMEGIYVDKIFPVCTPSVVGIVFEAHPKKRMKKAKLLKIPTRK